MGIIAMVKHAILGMLILAVSGTTAQAETCWSLMDTPDWPNIRASMEQIQICEVLPGGPDRTRRFEPSQIDICSASEGLRVKSRVETTCATSDRAVFKFSVSGNVSSDVTVDVGACRITSLDIGISGDVGKYLTNLGLLQPVLLGWAQGQLNRLCGKS